MPSIARLAVSAEEAAEVMANAGAYMQGHFLLSSGLHSPEYFQCATLLEQPAVAEHIAKAVAAICREWNVETVLSPALGAILFGYELSRALGCRNIFAERPGGKFELRRGFSLKPGERVLLAENVITTGGSVEETAEMARKLGANVAGYAVIVDRSGGRFAPNEPVAAYAAIDAKTIDPAACELCAAGIDLLKPGSRKF
ncbi:MAG: orotate phosphoribosyltransferase [Candidatus Sumerlaeaceae bacterium]|nr:orotate phosphoribosyltransferase [Candidatus Sumerlaeaceae bacterium]